MAKNTVTIELDQLALNAVLTSLGEQAKAMVAVGMNITEQAKAQVEAAKREEKADELPPA